VLLACRSEAHASEIEALRVAPQMISLPLAPLGAADVGRIAAGMTGMAELPPALRDRAFGHVRSCHPAVAFCSRDPSERS
jgi:hypothetical protein